MDERALDRTIDAAAGAMMAREPSRSLGYIVMTRVREGDTPAPRRFVWMTAVASLVLCGAIAMVVMSRTAATVITLPRAAQLPIGVPAMLPDARLAVVQEAAPARRTIGARRATIHAVARAALPPNDVSPIEPIQTEPIVLSALELPQLEREATAMDTLKIEPLTIEPLAASND